MLVDTFSLRYAFTVHSVSNMVPCVPRSTNTHINLRQAQLPVMLLISSGSGDK